jgi:hypothetical protein
MIKKSLTSLLLLFLLHPGAALCQQGRPAGDSTASPVMDSAFIKWKGVPSQASKSPAPLLHAPAEKLQSLNPANLITNGYKTGLNNLTGAFSQINPINKHTARINISNVSVIVSADYINGPVDSLIYGITDYNAVKGQVSGTVTAFNIPVNFGYQYQVTQGGGVKQNYSGTSFQFNKEAYTSYLASRLKGKFNPEDYLPQKFLSIDKMKQDALGDLQQDIGKVQQQYGNTQGTPACLTDWKTVNESDVNTLQRMILPDSLLKTVAANQVLLGQMQAKINNQQPIDTSQYNHILAQNQELKGRQQMLTTIMGYREKWQSSGLVNMIKKLDVERGVALGNVVKDPAVIEQLAKQKLSLTGLEKVFVDMKQLNIGRNIADMSPLTLQQSVFQNGLGTQLTRGATNMGLTAGKMPSLSSGYEQLFSGNSFNPSIAMAGLNMGKGNMQGNGSSISLNSFKAGAMSGLNGILPFSSGGMQSFVLTFGKSVQIGEHGHLMTEFSKSLTTGNTGQGNPGSSPGGLLSTNDFFKSSGVTVDYTNEYTKLELEQELKLSIAASDYSDPGNAYLFSGMKEISSNLRKTFLKKQLTITLRNSYASFLTDPAANGHFEQYNHLLDVRWKMKKGNYISFKYQPSWSDNVDSGMHRRVGMIQRYSAELNYNKRLAKHQWHTFTSLAYVNNSFADSILSGPPIAIHSFQLTSMVSVNIKSCQAYLNTTEVYTPGNSGYVYLNSTYNSEAGYMYPLGSHLQASSALGYTSVTDWYRQIGIKQSLSGALSQHITLSSYIDVGKNIAVFQSLPVPTIRGNFMLNYH